MSGIKTLPLAQFVPGTEGTYALPEDLYHDSVKAPGISRTLIVEFLQFTAAHAHSIMDGSYAKKPTEAMIAGSLIDRALLEPDRFKEGLSHWVIPEGMKLTTKEGIAWKKEHPGLPYIQKVHETKVSEADIYGMIASAMRHKKVRRIVEEATKQESAFCFDPATGLLRKVRPDNRLVDNHSRLVLADLKSIFRGGASTDVWQKHCARMAYHIQDSYYSDVYKDLTGEVPFFIFIVVERKPPYAVRLFQLDTVGKEHARMKYQRALEDFRRCQETGEWPAFDEEIHTISLPSWELRAPEPEPLDL